MLVINFYLFTCGKFIKKRKKICLQKIGNAIRSIDTWYAKYDKRQKPIAADPYGAVTNLGTA
jgi:hypothetical protein